MMDRYMGKNNGTLGEALKLGEDSVGGTKRVPLTEGLLHLIIMVQEYQQFIMSQSQFNVAHGKEGINWMEKSERFFNDIGDEILSQYNLSTNKISFQKVTEFRVTDEMENTEYSELPEKFTF